VIEYSGYSPSDPDEPQPSTLLANLMGFAVVGVNMRGSGCSGGVFDVFSPAQAADGYDVVETVARQPWVLHGRPGMVGLSYPGISQLYVAATRPPHLAAIAPMSVIDDLWRQQWPGGVYNSGFTRAWLAMRDDARRAGRPGIRPASTRRRIAREGQQCQSEPRLRTLRPGDRHLPAVARTHASPPSSTASTCLLPTGAWQNEQTGNRFTMLDASPLPGVPGDRVQRAPSRQL
jgi:hypothetical protein